MSNDIFSKYTDNRNKTAGRRGYYGWKKEKDTDISPKEYGIFLQRKRGRQQ